MTGHDHLHHYHLHGHHCQHHHQPQQQEQYPYHYHHHQHNPQQHAQARGVPAYGHHFHYSRHPHQRQQGGVVLLDRVKQEHDQGHDATIAMQHEDEEPVQDHYHPNNLPRKHYHQQPQTQDTTMEYDGEYTDKGSPASSVQNESPYPLSQHQHNHPNQFQPQHHQHYPTAPLTNSTPSAALDSHPPTATTPVPQTPRLHEGSVVLTQPGHTLGPGHDQHVPPQTPQDGTQLVPQTPKRGRKRRSTSKNESGSRRPKRPLTGYLIFMQQVRQDVVTANPNATFGRIGQIVGQKWANLPSPTRQHYEQLADQDKTRYRRELASYVPPQPPSPPPSRGGGPIDDDDAGGLTKPRRRKRRRRRKDPQEPKKARSSYTFFVQIVRRKVVEEIPGIGFSEIGRIVGERWRNLSPDDRRPYEDMAMKDHQRHEREMQVWRESQVLGTSSGPVMVMGCSAGAGAGGGGGGEGNTSQMEAGGVEVGGVQDGAG